MCTEDVNGATSQEEETGPRGGGPEADGSPDVNNSIPPPGSRVILDVLLSGQVPEASSPRLLADLEGYAQAGISIIPCRTETKRPSVRWKPYQNPANRASPELVRFWYGHGRRTYAAVCGAASDGLGVLDFDQPGILERWAMGIDLALLERLVFIRTGNRNKVSHQVWFRCENPGPNDHLAWVPDEEAANGRHIAIETRGEGGYAILAGSIHPSGGGYAVARGDLRNLPVLTGEEVERLYAVARQLDECPQERRDPRRARERARRDGQTQRTGGIIGAFNAKADVRDLLPLFGYTYCETDPEGNERWLRPGVNREGHEPGMVVFADSGRCFAWSTNDPLYHGDFDPPSHDSFSVLTELAFDGDLEAARQAAASLLAMDNRDLATEGATHE